MSVFINLPPVQLEMTEQGARIYSVFEIIASIFTIFIAFGTILITLVFKRLRGNTLSNCVRFMCLAGIGTELIKILNVSGMIDVYWTCPTIAIVSNTFWLWQDICLVVYNIQLLRYVLRNQFSKSKVTDCLGRWNFVLHVIVFLTSFMVFVTVQMVGYLVNTSPFRYDPVLKKCDFPPRFNIPIVLGTETLLFLINSVVLLVILIHIVRLRAYNEYEKQPWTGYLTMSFYPIVWSCTFVIVCIGLVTSPLNNNELPRQKGNFFDYVYLLFGPRFQTVSIMFTTGVILNKVETLDFVSTFGDIEFFKTFNTFLEGRNWLIACWLDFYLLKDSYQLNKKAIWNTYSHESEFIKMLGIDSEREFLQRVDFEIMIAMQEKLQGRLWSIFYGEYIKSSWYAETKPYFMSISENDSYVPLIYYIFRYGLARRLFEKKSKKLNLNIAYATQLRGILKPLEK